MKTLMFLVGLVLFGVGLVSMSWDNNLLTYFFVMLFGMFLLSWATTDTHIPGPEDTR